MANATSQRTAARALPLVRLEHLWALFALSIVGVFLSLWPTAPHDFWWHLKAGELIATSGIPTTNLFAWTLPADAPYVYQSWLGELLFFWLYRAGGLPLVVLARNLLGLGAFALVAYEARRRSGSWRLAALAALLAAAMAINTLTTRTQNWSWLPFVAVLVILGSYVDGQLGPRGLLALPVVMLFWVNAHGAFTMGLLAGLAFVVGETLRRWLKQPRALSWERLRWLYLALGGMLLATLANPLGFGIFGYVQTLLGNQPIQSLVIEWQPPTPRNLTGFFFYLGVLALLAAFAFARRRPTLTDVLLVCGLAWLSFGSVRSVIWFGMAAMPIAAQCLGAPRAVFTLGDAGAPRVSLRERGAGGAANLAVAALLALAVVAVQPWLKPALPLPQPYRDLFVDLPGAPQLASADTPAAAAEHLRAAPCAGRLFNEMGYGSYLAWALYPATQTFIDPRIELYPPDLWRDYIQISQGRDAARLLAQYDIACVLLDQATQAGLAEAMPGIPGWRRTFAEGRSEVWRR